MGCGLDFSTRLVEVITRFIILQGEGQGELHAPHFFGHFKELLRKRYFQSPLPHFESLVTPPPPPPTHTHTFEVAPRALYCHRVSFTVTVLRGTFAGSCHVHVPPSQRSPMYQIRFMVSPFTLFAFAALTLCHSAVVFMVTIGIFQY